jgi:eukaryotic-like serine/threonine-protein kinase
MQNSPARSSIDVGSVIADTYTIEALIGRGGMGAVFLASHKRLPGKKVAIKLLLAEMSGDEVLARFKREAEIASRLAHPNIVGVHDYNVMPDGTPYVVLDYLEGASLAQHLVQGPIALDRALSIVRQVGSALAAAHREGIVHRDLKPQNIFLVPTEVEGSTREVAKVLDFGISKIRGSDTVKTQDSALLGTPQYMAPEQATGQHDKVDERTDLFALGAIVYEMLTGQPAFSGANIPEVVFKVVYEQPRPLAEAAPGTPAHVVAAVETAMAKPQAERYPNVSAFALALTGSPLSVNRTASLPPASSKPRSRNTGKEAFDQTVGSGDHGPVQGTAPTVASRSEPIPKQPRTTSKAWLAAIAGVVVIGAGIALAMSRGGKDKPAPAPAPTPVAVVIPDAAAVAPPPAVVDAATPMAIDAGSVAVDAATHTKAPPAKKLDAAVAPEPPDDETAAPGEEETLTRLEQADQALARGEYAKAEKLANAVINGESVRPAQKGRAHAIHGVVECALHNDRGLALADLRASYGPKQRKKLLDGCAAAGMTLDPQ